MTPKSTLTDTRLRELMREANPLAAARAAALPTDAAADDLLVALLAEPVSRETPTLPVTPSSPARRRPVAGRLWPRVAVAVGVVFVALMAVLSLGGDRAGRSSTAWAAELVRFAEASPRVLLDAPGWRVDYADEQSEQEGEMTFTRGASDTRPSDGDAPPAVQLHWRPKAFFERYKDDRAASSSAATTAPVLGTTADVYRYEGQGVGGLQDITALWRYDGRVLEFRAQVADVAAFKALLLQLARVDTDAWLSALPKNSVVQRADRSTVIAGMLRGLPLPPGFDPQKIKGAALTSDRYQLGATVAGTVACTWVGLWSQARRDGDSVGVRRAIAAMATAKDWPILNEMTKEGDYPESVEEYAAAMPSGHVVESRPLVHDVNLGLGCAEWGVKLPETQR